MNALTKVIQMEGFVPPAEIKPSVGKDGIFFPVSAKHENLNKYHGDARSFGYDFDDGHCTVVIFEKVVGVLADDTKALFDECAEMKRYGLKKPRHSMLECVETDVECDRVSSELLIRYDEECFYKDAHGFWFTTKYFDHGTAQRVTDESAEIYREVNKEYQRQIVNYNKVMKEALENMATLKKSLAE